MKKEENILNNFCKMSEKIIYISNISDLPDIERKQWIFNKTSRYNFANTIVKNDILWFIIVKSNKNEVYRGNIQSVIKNCKKNKNIIIFSNIIKIDYQDNNIKLQTINKLHI